MRAVRSRDTKPETEVRRMLHARGFRFRVNLRLKLEGGAVRPDIVFPTEKIAVFIDGCYWHACPEHGSRPQHNRQFWDEKFARNKQRDLDNNQLLTKNGWKVLRYWEHESSERATAFIATAVSDARLKGVR